MRRALSIFTVSLMHRYLLKTFLVNLIGCLFAFAALFIVFDFFERVRVFIREGSTIWQAATYVLLRFPLVVHLTLPIAALIATLFTVGRLSQLSEIVAMRAAGQSLFWILRPFLWAGLAISLLIFVLGETVVPWASFRLEELYQVDIRKKAESGSYSRENFWYRVENQFYTIGFYDSRSATLSDVAVLELGPDFELRRRVSAEVAQWEGALAGWSMQNVTETVFNRQGRMTVSRYASLPLVIDEKPSDFYNMQRKPESLSYFELKRYIEKLRGEGVPVTEYEVSLASKLSTPFVSVIAVLIAFPFGLVSSRSRTLTLSFVTGVAVGFSYHFIHAIFSAFGSAELLPVTVAAWTANILGVLAGLYFMCGAETES